MKMKKSLSAILTVFALLVSSCSNWMKDDDFYNKIENDVKVANAASVNVYVRYANSKMGSTEPSASTTLKVDIPADISAVTSDDYGFVKWAAFSTKDFPTSRQHSDLFYDSAEKYAADFQKLELPASEVSFEDPKSPSTKVTINTTRSDIFITPLVAKRPTVVTSVPSNGRSDVVRNTSIRILFSKKIEPASLKDEYGNSNIVITSGSAVLTETSGDLAAKDITDNCNITLGKTGKMLTISPKKGFYFDNNSQITVNIYEDVCDTDGYGMNGKYSFSFTTGVKLDSLAPRIEDLWASIDADFSIGHRFEQYKYISGNETPPVYKTEADNATNNISAYVSGGASYYDTGKKQILTQRVKDYLNIYVRAADIAGSGGNIDTSDTNNLSESDVALVQIRACLYIDKDGNPVTTSADAFADDTTVPSSYYIETKNIGYAPGLKDSGCKVQSTFETVFPDKAGGTLFTYDLSSLPDGLIKIDIWAVDMVGNSGETESYVKQEYNNNYRSIFVVKDEQAPDSAAAKDKVSITAPNAPYDWFNATTLGQMQIQDKAGALITDLKDSNNVHLNADVKDLKWTFKLGNDPNWNPLPTDKIPGTDTSIWENVHDSSGQPKIKQFTNATSAADGGVNITMCLMDDLGNVSAPVLLNSVKYDNTTPEIVTDAVYWVKKNNTKYEKTVSTTSKALLNESGHILRMPFKEATAGIRRFRLTVTDAAGNPITQDESAQTGYKIVYQPILVSNPERELSFTSVPSLDNIKEINVDDSNKLSTGFLYISNLKIGNSNGTYKIKLEVWDSSLNSTYTETEVTIDTVPPIIQKLHIPGLKHSLTMTTAGENTNNTDDGWFLPKDYIRGPNAQSSITPSKPGYIPLDIFLKEQDSGICKIVFDASDDVELYETAVSGSNERTKLWKIENYGQSSEVRTQIPDSDYTIDAVNKTIILNEDKCIKSSSETFVIRIENIGFSSYKTGANNINVSVYDLATLSASKNEITNDKGAVVAVKADSSIDQKLTSYALLDKGTTTSTLAAAPNYTNDDIINMTVEVSSDNGNSGKSGYNSFRISGANFIPGSTEVKLSNQTVTYELSENNTVLTLRKKNGAAFTDDYYVVRGAVITFNNIQIENSEGEKNISITAYDLAGWNANTEQKKITYDHTAPTITKLPFVTDYSGSPDYYKPKYNVYPHEGTSDDTGVLINGVPTFYTATTHRSGATQTNGLLGGIINSQYGVVLGVTASDSHGLYSNSSDKFIRYYKHTGNETNVTKEKVIQSGVYANTDLGNTAANGTLKTGFDVGEYSAIVVDSAGNTSDVFHFNVVQDVSKPADFGMNLVTIEKPSNTGIYRYANDKYSNESLDSFVFDFRDSSNSAGNTAGIWVNKYVIKKTKASDKYKIVFKFNGTSAGDELLTGSTVSSTSSYNETFSSTATSSPIEQYAISTWYGAWSTTNEVTSGHQTQAAVPENTVLPNGVEITTSNYSTTSNQILEYFGYTFSDNFYYKNGSWVVPSGKNSWHNYKSGSTYTDTGNGITSYINSDNNLVIEIPHNNTKYLPPITVFLRDGCGNMKSLVLKTSNNFVISFVTDGMLGYQTTDDNGQVTSPIVIQNPFMDPAGTGMTWDGQTYSWNEQSGNYDKTTDNGVGEKRGFIKNLVKNQTYYNDAYTNFKLALTLRFGTTSGNKDSQETALFSSAGKTTSTTDYTCRAVLYTTTNANEVPDYSTITAGKADTDWTYSLADSSSSEIRILLDYPKPSYNTPFYIWYLLEDRLGNYEIAKVVNSAASGNALRANTAGMFDKWVYDNEGPILTTRQSGLDPSQVDDINELVGKNNGFVPYEVDNGSTKTVYIHATKTHSSPQPGEEINNTVGAGTSHLADGEHEPYSIYNSFADLAVSEITGVRAFAWSTEADPPSIDDSLHGNWDNSKWYKDSVNQWYVGWEEVENLRKDIGLPHTYSASDGVKPANAYYSNTSGDYEGKYSGIKVITVFPYGKLSSSSATALYLHVMDWTGNISSYRVGKNIEFINDSIAPEYTSSSVAGTSVADQYYIKKDDSANPVVRIAGNGTIAQSHQPIDVYIPSGYFSESGSGIKGYSLTSGNSGSADYLRIPYDTYDKEDPQDLTYYVYDNVGNRSQQTLQLIFDANPPKISTVSLVTQSGSDTEIADSTGLITNTVSGYGKVWDYPYASAPYYRNATQIDSSKLQVIYLNKTGYAKFHVNLDDHQASYYEDVDDVQINKWNGTAWQTVARYNKSNSSLSSGDWSGDYSTGFYMGSGPSYGYTLDFDSNGTYYQILVSDISGNTSCQYFKLYLDSTAPVFDGNPVLTVTKGSVNKIGDSTSYAYTADSSNKAKLTIKIKDEGVGAILHKYQYKIDTGSWSDWIDSTSQVYTFDYNAFSGNNIEKIYLRDIFGNESTGTVTYTYSTANDISKLVYYNGSSVTKPSLTGLGVRTKRNNDYTDNNQYWDISTTTSSVIIKDADRKKIEITFQLPSDNSVIGYIESDSQPASTLDTYSLRANANVKTVFEYDLPMGTGKYNVPKKYWAVDCAGYISESFTINYTNNDPTKVQNIGYLAPGSEGIPETLNLGSITLASTVVNGSTRYIDSTTGGYILLRCTVSGDSKDEPAKLNLYAGNSDTGVGDQYTTSESTEAKKLRVFTGGDAGGGRQYRYLVIKLSSTHSNKKLWCTVTSYDGRTVSDKQRLDATANNTWVYDNAGPTLVDNDDLYEDENETVNGQTKSIHKVWGYTHSSSTHGDYYGGITAALPMVKDSYQVGENYNTNLYITGTDIYILKSKITDGAGVTHYQWVTSSDFGGTANNTNWVQMTEAPDTNYWKFPLPNITTPHTRLALFFKDSFGNVSDAYYIGHNVKISGADGNWDKPWQVQWWLVDNTISSGTATITNPSSGWTGAGNYTFKVTPAAGSIIKSVSATVGGTTVPVTAVTFVDYDKGQPTFSNGSFSNGYVHIGNGINVTLNMSNVQQGWSAKDVVITLTGHKLGSTTATSTGFVTAKTLTADDITLTVTPSSWDEQTDTYTVIVNCPVAIQGTPGVDNATLDSWNAGTKTAVLKGITQGDTPKDVKLIINTFEKLVFIVSAKEESGGNGGNGDPQGNKFSSGLFTGLLDTSKIVSSGDLAASQISAMSGRGIIMNKDLEATYISSSTTGQSRAAKKAARAAKKAAKKAEKASAKTVKEKPLVQEFASQIEDLGITEAFVDSVVLEDLPLSEQIIKEDISQVTAKTDFVMSPIEKVEIADTIQSDTSSAAQAQQEKSSSKAALIVVMLAILSALAGAWYLRKGRK